MNPHERQQFDVLLQTGVDRFAERLIQRNEGAARARLRLGEAPDGDGVWLTDFVDAFFDEHLLGDAAGAGFVLEALARRPLPPLPPARTIGEALSALAAAAFAALLKQKTLEELARREGYQAVEPAAS